MSCACVTMDEMLSEGKNETDKVAEFLLHESVSVRGCSRVGGLLLRVWTMVVSHSPHEGMLVTCVA